MRRLPAFLSAAAIVTSLLAATPAQAAFTRAPWVQDVTAGTITIAWEAGSAGGTQQVAWGEGANLDQVATGTVVTGNVYAATISGLASSSSFSYQVTSNSDVSPVKSVATAPNGAEPFRFVAYGDNRSDATAHAAVVDGIVSKTPDFVINTGDMALIPYYTEFFQIEAPLLSDTPIFPVPGNHDGTSSFYTQSGFDRPPYYSFRWGNAFFLAISTEDDYSTGSTEYNWVDSELQTAKADPSIQWIFAYHHYPVYSSSNHGSTAALQTSLNNLYKQYGVDIVFNGHDHDYERSELDGVVYVVAGGGGAPLYSAGTDCPGHVISESANSFVTVDIDGSHLDMTAWRTDGSTIDTRSIDKSTSTTPTPTPTGSGTPGVTPTPNPTGTPGGGNGDNGGANGYGCDVGGMGGAFAGGAAGVLAALLVAGGLVARRRRA